MQFTIKKGFFLRGGKQPNLMQNPRNRENKLEKAQKGIILYKPH